MKQLTLVKLGGSVITDKTKPYTARKRTIHRLAQELKTAKQQMIISHGGGSFAHTSAAKYGGMKGYKSTFGIAKVAYDSLLINQIVMEVLLDEELSVVSVPPLAMILAKSGKLDDHFFRVIEEMISQGVIPVVFGNPIWDTEWKSTIFSGEKTLNEIALYLLQRKYKINKVIQVGNTYGVYDDQRRTIETITKNNWEEVRKHIEKSSGIDVTGGMKHKIEEALKMAEKEIETILINGTVPKELSKALTNQKVKGTTII